MRKRETVVAGVALFAAVVGLSANGYGKGMGRGEQRHWGGPPVFSNDSSMAKPSAAVAGNTMRLLQQVGLTAEQRTAIAAVLESYRADAETLATNLRTERVALRDLVQAENPDAQAIRDQTAKAALVEADLQVLWSKAFHDIRNNLTEAQLATFFALQSQQDTVTTELGRFPGACFME